MILVMNGIVLVLKINQFHAIATMQKILIAKDNMLATVIQVRFSKNFFFLFKKKIRREVPSQF